jgi:hypothetical protein
MLMQRILTGTIVLCLAAVVPALSQSKEGKRNTVKEKKPSVKPDENTRVLLFPDFYNYKEVKKGDTGYSFELVNRKMATINFNSLKNVDDIDHMKYNKSFCRFPKNPNSPISPPIEFIAVYEYGHPGPDTWVRFDHNTGTMTRYKLYKNQIVRTEKVTVIDPATNATQNVIIKYYKTEASGTEKSQGHHHHG